MYKYLNILENKNVIKKKRFSVIFCRSAFYNFKIRK